MFLSHGINNHEGLVHEELIPSISTGSWEIYGISAIHTSLGKFKGTSMLVNRLETDYIWLIKNPALFVICKTQFRNKGQNC